MSFTFIKDCILDVCILIGGVGGIVTLYNSFWPKLRITTASCVHKGYVAAAVTVTNLNNKLIEFESIHVHGHKIARQKTDEQGHDFGCYQLHCVRCPDDSEFVDSLPISGLLEKRLDSETFIFVIKSTNSESVRISLRIKNWIFPIWCKTTY